MKILFKELLDFFQPRPIPSDVFYQRWLDEMGRYDYKEIKEMTDVLIKSQQRFPSLSQCIAVVDSIAERNRETSRTTENKEEKVRAREFFTPDGQQTDWQKKVHKLIIGLLTGQLTRGQYLIGARSLDINVDSLQRHYISQKLDLKGYAGQIKEIEMGG